MVPRGVIENFSRLVVVIANHLFQCINVTEHASKAILFCDLCSNFFLRSHHLLANVLHLKDFLCILVSVDLGDDLFLVVVAFHCFPLLREIPVVNIQCCEYDTILFSCRLSLIQSQKHF